MRALVKSLPGLENITSCNRWLTIAWPANHAKLCCFSSKFIITSSHRPVGVVCIQLQIEGILSLNSSLSRLYLIFPLHRYIASSAPLFAITHLVDIMVQALHGATNLQSHHYCLYSWWFIINYNQILFLVSGKECNPPQPRILAHYF